MAQGSTPHDDAMAFAEALDVVAMGSMPPDVIEDATAAVRTMAYYAARRIQAIELTLPATVEVRLCPLADRIISSPGLMETLPDDGVRVSLTIKESDWAGGDWFMAAHEFGHMIVRRFARIGSLDFAFLVEEYLAEREAWPMLTKIDQWTAPQALAAAKMGLDQHLLAVVTWWRRYRRDYAKGDSGYREGLFEDKVVELTRIIAYAAGDAHFLEEPLGLPTIPRYAQAAFTSIFEPLEQAGRALPDEYGVTDLAVFAAAMELGEANVHATLSTLAVMMAAHHRPRPRADG